MRFTPNYTVSYNGQFHKAGESFEISHADVNEMKKHGTVQEPELTAEPGSEETADSAENPVKRPGRPRKNQTGGDAV